MIGHQYSSFELGEIAFNQGLSMNTNPFKPYTPDYYEWANGYLIAKAQASQETTEAAT